MRMWLTAIAVLALGTSANTQESQGDAKPSEAAFLIPAGACGEGNQDDRSPEALAALRQFALLKKESEDLEAASLKALEAASPQDLPKLRDEYMNRMFQARGAYAVKAMELARALDPRDPAIFEPLLFVLQNGFSGRKPAEVAQAKEWLLKHQVDHPQFGSVISFIANLGPDQMVVIESIARQAKNPSTKGQAFYALGYMNLQHSSGIVQIDEKASDERLKSAKNYFELVVRSYPEVETSRGKAGVLARGLLNEMMNLKVGNAAPEVVCLNIHGNRPDQLSQYRGKVVVLDIWAIWSRQSVAAIPERRKLVEQFQGRRFALISVCGDAKRETLDRFLEKNKMPWTHWFAGQSGIILDWGVRKYPTTYIIDHNGVIRAKDLRGKPLEAKVLELLAAMEQPKSGQ